MSLLKKLKCLSGTKKVKTKLGTIEYISFGEGPTLLWVHGILGGADQAYLFSQPLLSKGFRIVAISRFGYMDSPLPENSSPAAQADLYAALLDTLNITKISILGFSAGGPSALQFALRYPDRCSSLILLSAAVPPYKIPSRFIRLIARKFFGSDLIIWYLINYFPSIMLKMMGVPRGVQKGLSDTDKKWLSDAMFAFLPVSSRIGGILNDIWITNPDLNKQYPYEKIAIPTLVIHAVDDPMPPFAIAKKIAERIPHSKFVAVKSGGHLHVGHQSLLGSLISKFIKEPETARSSLTNESLTYY